MEPFKGNPGLDDGIYMCGESHPTESYSGVFRDEEVITDAAIVNFIRGTNWTLFAKLRGMPWISAGEPLQAQDVDADAPSEPVINPAILYADSPSEPVIDPAILYAESRMRSPDKHNDPRSRSSSGTEGTILPQSPEYTPSIVMKTTSQLQTLQSRVLGKFTRIILLGYTLTQNRGEDLFCPPPFRPQ